jgi:hypothetical protein
MVLKCLQEGDYGGFYVHIDSYNNGKDPRPRRKQNMKNKEQDQEAMKK